jgi:hypothetical protein
MVQGRHLRSLGPRLRDGRKRGLVVSTSDRWVGLSRSSAMRPACGRLSADGGPSPGRPSRSDGFSDGCRAGGGGRLRLDSFAVARSRHVVPQRHGDGPTTAQDNQVKDPTEQLNRPQQHPAGHWCAGGGWEPPHRARAVRPDDVALPARGIDRIRESLGHNAIVVERHFRLVELPRGRAPPSTRSSPEHRGLSSATAQRQPRVQLKPRAGR